MEEELYCPNCGGLLEKVEEYDTGEGIETEFHCNECGVDIDVFKYNDEDGNSEEEESGFGGGSTVIGPQGFGTCPYCGGNLAWSSDFMRSEIDWHPDTPLEADALAQNLNCYSCGRSFTVKYPNDKYDPNIDYSTYDSEDEKN